MSSGGGSRASGSGGAARTSVNRDFNSTDLNRSRNVTNTTTTRNVTDVNVNRTDVNVNRNYDLDVDVDRNWHPVATGAAFAAGAAITSAAIGSVVYSLPSSCTVTVADGVSYQQCGSTWYQPRFYGTSVSYVVVRAP
jgi:hypothetical protein